MGLLLSFWRKQMDFSQPSTKCQTHGDFMGFTPKNHPSWRISLGILWIFNLTSGSGRKLGKATQRPQAFRDGYSTPVSPPKIYKPMYGRFCGENDDPLTMFNGIFVVFPNIFRQAIGFWWYFPAKNQEFRRMVRRLVRMAWPSNMPAKSCKRMRSCWKRPEVVEKL